MAPRVTSLSSNVVYFFFIIFLFSQVRFWPCLLTDIQYHRRKMLILFKLFYKFIILEKKPVLFTILNVSQPFFQNLTKNTSQHSLIYHKYSIQLLDVKRVLIISLSLFRASLCEDIYLSLIESYLEKTQHSIV